MTLQASAARLMTAAGKVGMARAIACVAVAVGAGLVAGCGAKVKPPVFEEDDPRAAREAALEDGDPAAPAAAASGAPGDPGAATAEAVALPPRPLAPPGSQPRTGIIERGALLGVLDQGPGGFLRAVEISPFFEGSRFLGWRLDQIVDRASPLYGVDLALGDIVLAVNRRPLARPEHLMALWQELRGADELIAQVWRGAGAFELRFAITPKAAAQPAPAAPPLPQRPPVAPAATPAPTASAAKR